ncbi:D-alanyl-D-alanine carboxypeptidase family protein [Anaerosporobacter faecicola]|uniref:D-alanyl-D-alanine carboxypeptidase family protein n=1 Tax=Anaerosporobacter faecicola TaxID=2718714 RepID=UPI00143B623E|nr:D-alanyl-D-alanine carboxypeptidase family protein [Anaerosporobacter faecicola]
MRRKIASILICTIALAVIAMLYYPLVHDQVKEWPQYKIPILSQNYSKNCNETLRNESSCIGERRVEEVTIVTKPITKENGNLQLNARAACLMDASNMRILYGKEADQEMPMASTTKIMTLIVTLENANLDDVVKVSKNAAKQPDVQLNMQTGDEYKLGDLLYSLMLESHNDTAVAIAEHVGGTVEGFAQMMNKKAQELGCTHTNFVTPNGLDSMTEEHYTTARELGKIASYAIQNQQFREIVNTPNWTFKELTKGTSYSVSNKDRFLYIYDGAIGIKTGFTNKAGYCFVGAVEKGEKTLVSVVLASGWPPNKNYKWKDTTSLMDYGMNNYQLEEIFDDTKLYEPVYVKRGKESYVDLYCEGTLQLLKSKSEEVKVIYEIEKEVKAPVVANQEVGVAKYYLEDEYLASFPIRTTYGVEAIDLNFTWNQILELWLGVAE